MDRIFGGAMALLSIQMAAFVVVFGQYQAEVGRAAQAKWGLLALISGALIVWSCIIALAVHMYSGPETP